MPRNSSGTYSLVAGNPVIANTLIETGWANPTMGDIAQALSDSLDRYGRGSMLAPLKFADGTVAAPGISFGSESSTGFYRPSAGTLATSVTGIEVMEYKSDGVTTFFPFKAKIGGTNIVSIDATEVTSSVPVSSPAPVDADHLANKAYVDTKFSGAAGGGYLPLGGGTLSGALTVAGAGTNIKNDKPATGPVNGSMWSAGNMLAQTTDGVTFPAIGFHRSGASVAAALYYSGNAVSEGFKWVGSDGTVRTLWDSSNDGSGSGLDAGLLAGASLNSANSAWTVVQRTGGGDIVVGDVYATKLRNGPGDAGNLKCHGTANNVCFRWDGNRLCYRVDEANDIPISSATLDFPVAFAFNGWTKLPNGVYAQWCTVACNGDSTATGNWPTAFPRWCLGAVACVVRGQGDGSGNVYSAHIVWTNTAQFAVGVTDAGFSIGTATVQVIAWGG